MRNALVIGGLVVAGVIVALYIALSKDTTTSAPATGTDTPVIVEPTKPPPVGNATVTEGTIGERPATPTPSGGSPREYVVGDVHVRDHREGEHKPLDIPPNVRPAEGRRLPSTLTHEVAQQVRDVMEQCVASLPKQARGEKPRLEGQIEVSIKSNKLSVTKSTMQMRDVTGESVEPTRQCIEQKTIGLQNAAPDQADLDSYAITISFAIP